MQHTNITTRNSNPRRRKKSEENRHDLVGSHGHSPAGCNLCQLIAVLPDSESQPTPGGHWRTSGARGLLRIGHWYGPGASPQLSGCRRYSRALQQTGPSAVIARGGDTIRRIRRTGGAHSTVLRYVLDVKNSDTNCTEMSMIYCTRK